MDLIRCWLDYIEWVEVKNRSRLAVVIDDRPKMTDTKVLDLVGS